MNPLSCAVAGALVSLALSGCSRRPTEVAAAVVERGVFGYAESDPVEPVEPVGQRVAQTPTERGCELVMHTGRCELTSVSVERDERGEREVVALYRGLDSEASGRFERRFRVSYLARSEDEQVALVRERSVLRCRWQTVVRGACQAYPSEVESPEAELFADARESSRHRHHRHGERRHRHRHNKR